MAKTDPATTPTTWLAQAKFMRDVDALHAEWTPQYHGDGTTQLELTKLTLAPTAPGPTLRTVPIPQPTPARPAPPTANSPAARLARMHETMFAASSMKPKLHLPPEGADVPRAASAKKAAARGAKKASKRGT